jgi:H+/Cl- antiporter ClcA
VALLVLGAIIGVPAAVVAYFFLKLVNEAQTYLFTTLPTDIGFHAEPTWWPVPLLALCGLLVAASIAWLPGTGGHNPADGFKPSGTVAPIDLPGIVAAALATLCLGAVLGPEAPLVLIGAGIGVLIVRTVKRDAPAMAVTVIGAAGSFAAIATLLGSPITGAFLLMEAAGIGGPTLELVLLPGLLAAGIGSLIFVGLDNLTGFGTFSLAVPNIPHFGAPTGGEFLWALAIGLAAAVIGTGIRRLAHSLQPLIATRSLLWTPALGLAIAVLAIIFFEITGKSSSQVLFSGENALSPLIEQASTWSAGALVTLIICKGLAYGASLAGFRGGPTFPGMFIGAAGGIALSHLAGLPMIAGAAMGIGAMTVVMLGGMPLTAVLLATLLLEADGLALMPLVIVAVVVAYVVAARLAPAPGPAVQAGTGPAPVAVTATSPPH